MSIYEFSINKSKEILIAECNGNLPIANKMELNIYIDEPNKVVHIYDPFENNTTSIINILNESFIIELFEAIGKKKKKYQVYTYMKPIYDEKCVSAYDYKSNDFYQPDIKKVFNIFNDRAKNKMSIIK